MKKHQIRRGSGFTLIEMMLVVGVIGILMGLLGAASYAARQRAYAALAQSEVQQIVAAFKSHWVAKGVWPDGFGSSFTKLTEDNLKPLMGDNEEGTIYINIPENRFEGKDKYYCDPWGNPYEVSIEQISEPLVTDTFEGAVSFPNFMRHYYEPGVYDSASTKWTWDAYY